MRNLPRPQLPHNFEEICLGFSQAYPPAAPERTEGRRWEAFKNEEQAMYALIKERLLQNQQGLCAFCECELTEYNREIEHFRPKNSTSPEQDWTICFTNYTLSCKGKISADEDDHCGHLKDNIEPEGNILDPYELPLQPLVKYEVTDQQLRLLPDADACHREKVDVALVQLTMDNLGLNCCSLMRSRWEVWNSLNDQIADTLDIPNEQQVEEQQNLVDDNIIPVNGMLRSFITTRRLLFSKELPEFM